MDKREAILARLLVVLQAAAADAGVTNVFRNQDIAAGHQLPAIVLLDADEAAEPGNEGFEARAPNRVTLTPEIYLIIADQPGDIGTELNALRAKVLRAILTDDDLKTLTGSNGGIRYDGCATGLSRGRTMNGEMGVSVSFTYVLNPLKL